MIYNASNFYFRSKLLFARTFPSFNPACGHKPSGVCWRATPGLLFPRIASSPRRRMLTVRRKRLMAEFSAACSGFLLALFRAARMCRSLCRFLPLRKARIRRSALFRGDEASFTIAHQIHAPSLPERPQNQRAVFGPGSLQQRALHGLFAGRAGDVHALHGARIQPCVIHGRRERARRGIEVLHLFRTHVFPAQIKRELDGVLQRAARMAGHEIRHQILLLPKRRFSARNDGGIPQTPAALAYPSWKARWRSRVPARP